MPCFFLIVRVGGGFPYPKWKQSPQAAVAQLLSRAQLFATPWTAACQASLSFAIPQSLGPDAGKD